MLKVIKIPANMIVSDTTRPPRIYEENGLDYNFLSETEFHNKINYDKYLEYSYFNGWFYGTDYDTIDINSVNIGIFNIDGISSIAAHQDKYEMLQNDDKILDFIPAIWGAMKDNCPVYEFCGWQSLKQWLEYFENTSLDLKNVIIWKKNNWSMGDLKGAYAGQYEVILYLNKGRVELNGARDTDIWEFDREPPKMHPTMKPIELIAYALNKSSKKGDVVLDCFGGSGSTLIACEQTGRKCYTCEIDPKYADVIIARYEKLTGNKAVLLT